MQRDSKVRQIASTYPKDQNKTNMQAVKAGGIKKAQKHIKIIITFREKGKGKRLLTHSLLMNYMLRKEKSMTYTQFSSDRWILEKSWRQLGLKIPLVHLWKKSIREEEERRQGQVRTATKSVTKSIPQNTRGEDEDFVGGLSKWWKPGISSNKSAEKKRKKKKKEEGKVHRRASNEGRLHRRNDANKDQTVIEEGRTWRKQYEKSAAIFLGFSILETLSFVFIVGIRGRVGPGCLPVFLGHRHFSFLVY